MQMDRGRPARTFANVTSHAVRLRQGFAGLCILSAEALAQADAGGRGCEKIVVAAEFGLGFAIAVICEASHG
jgi:hypothetical protein